MAKLETLENTTDANRFGGKASGLARLVQDRAPVPGGVVVDAAHLDDHLVRNGLSASSEALFRDADSLSVADLKLRCEQIRVDISKTQLDRSLLQAVNLFLLEQGPGEAVAVRSSAVGEDSQVASFAGQFDSMLGVTTIDEAEQAILTVWCSLFTPSALRYGGQTQRSPRRMAVVIQRQVNAKLSGVLFTTDPTAPGTARMLLECCAGLADRLVAGEIDPARGTISEHGDDIDWTSTVGIDTELTDQAIGRSLINLIQLARRLHQLRNHAQDIEWCIDQNGQLMLVQCRPVTATNIPRMSAANVELWSNANIAENYPEPVVPMLASFASRAYAGYFRGLGRAIGVSAARMDAMAPAFDGLVDTQAGRLYYNLSNIHSVLRMAPAGRWLAQSFNLFTGAQGMPNPVQIPQSFGAKSMEMLRIVLSVPALAWTVRRRVRRFERRADAYARQTKPRLLNQLSPDALASLIQQFLHIRLNRWTDAALADAAAMICYAGLKVVLQRWLPGAKQSQLQNDLLQGLPGLASARPVDRLWSIAQSVRQDPSTRDAMQTMTATELAHLIRDGKFPKLQSQLNEYFEHDGFRYSGELMLVQATPAEDPVLVIQLIQSYLKHGSSSPSQVVRKRAATREQVTRETSRHLSWIASLHRVSVRATIIRYMVLATQGAIKLRERARMKQALLYTRLRLVALALAGQLCRAGTLQSEQDIFFLTIDEAIGLGNGEPAKDIADRIATRRAEYDRHFIEEPPEQFRCLTGNAWPQVMSADEPFTATAHAMQGLGACGGAFEGPATVARDVSDTEQMPDSAVLVARQTDPGWASVFFMVKGLVVERGGMLSHGAIIAREYGIPAVIGVRGATQLIAQGERIRVDGDRGRVISCHE